MTATETVFWGEPPAWARALMDLTHRGRGPIPWPGALLRDYTNGARLVCLGRLKPDGSELWVHAPSESAAGVVVHPLNFLGDAKSPLHRPSIPDAIPTDSVVLDLEDPETRAGLLRRAYVRFHPRPTNAATLPPPGDLSVTLSPIAGSGWRLRGGSAQVAWRAVYALDATGDPASAMTHLLLHVRFWDRAASATPTPV